LEDDKPYYKEWWFGNQPIKNGGWTFRVLVLHDKGFGVRQIVDFFAEPFLIEMHHSSLPDCLMCFFLPRFTCITYIALYNPTSFQLFWGTVLDQSHICHRLSLPCQETKNGARECVRLCRPSPEFRKLKTRFGKISFSFRRGPIVDGRNPAGVS